MHQGPSVTTYSCGMALRSCAASAEAEALGPRPPVGSRSRRVVPCLPRPRGRRCFRCELHAHRAPSRAAPRAQYGQAGPGPRSMCAAFGIQAALIFPVATARISMAWPVGTCAGRCLLAPRALSPPLSAGTTCFVAAVLLVLVAAVPVPRERDESRRARRRHESWHVQTPARRVFDGCRVVRWPGASAHGPCRSDSRNYGHSAQQLRTVTAATTSGCGQRLGCWWWGPQSNA